LPVLKLKGLAGGRAFDVLKALGEERYDLVGLGLIKPAVARIAVRVIVGDEFEQSRPVT